MDKFKFSFKETGSFSDKRREDEEFMEELNNETGADLVKKGYTLDEEDIGEINCDETDEPEDDEFSDDSYMDEEDSEDDDEKDDEENDEEEDWEDEKLDVDFPPEPVKRGRGRPKQTEEEKEAARVRRGGQPGNQNASLANRQNRTAEKAISPYLEDIKNPVRKRKYASYLSKVRNKELSLDETEALLHMMIAEQQRRPAKSRDNKLVLDAASQLRQLTETKRKQEESTLAIMRDTKIMDMFQEWAKIIPKYITDPLVLAALIKELRLTMNSAIDVKNLNRSIDNNIKNIEG